MTKYQRVTGMLDVLFDDQPYWRFILAKIQETTDLFGYQRIDTPLLEQASLFVRGVGQGTDIVEKEMYIFEDRDGDQLALRPEFTAGIMRAYVENGLHTLPTPLRVWTTGPLFRHERQQKGRYRQHSQFDVEVIGEQDPAVDVEVISLAWHLFTSLGFYGLRLYINSTGCPVCKPAYIKTLVNYFEPFADKLPPDDKMRLQKNPLRILDSKEPLTQPLLENAPRITDHLCDDCASHFARLKTYLEAIGRPYIVDYRIVRGLDYYTKTVFEIKADGLGSQDTICGGGRYDGLIEELGGRPTPGIGFGSGIERYVIALRHLGVEPPPEPLPQVTVSYLGDTAKLAALKLVEILRKEKIGAMLTPGDRSLKAQLKSADRAKAAFAIILGEDEVKAGQAMIRDLSSSQQLVIKLADAPAWLKDRLQGSK
ncbi:MAG: histidine--tRNA ligase [Anaerolineae bacterium]|nr:histidine--tRNA ligase [Anaerolineales bacterium]MCQ3978845.1 histidine--tRNA ligase [Anaerolineae bacterium]